MKVAGTMDEIEVVAAKLGEEDGVIFLKTSL